MQSAGVPTPPYPVAPENQPLLKELQSLPYSEKPYEGAPVFYPDLAYDAISKEERQKVAEAAKASQQMVNLAGIETAGGKIWVPGKSKEVQLPDNVYISHYIAFVECYPDSLTYCPGTPFYVLNTIDNQTHIRLEPDGQAYIWDKGEMTPDRYHLYKSFYQPILDQLGTTLLLDPTIVRAKQKEAAASRIQ